MSAQPKLEGWLDVTTQLVNTGVTAYSGIKGAKANARAVKLAVSQQAEDSRANYAAQIGAKSAASPESGKKPSIFGDNGLLLGLGAAVLAVLVLKK